MPTKLTEDERSLMAYLTICSVAAQLGITEDEAETGLDELASRGEIRFRWNDTDAFIIVASDHVLVHASREWLAFAILTKHPVPDDASELLDSPPN